MNAQHTQVLSFEITANYAAGTPQFEVAAFYDSEKLADAYLTDFAAEECQAFVAQVVMRLKERGIEVAAGVVQNGLVAAACKGATVVPPREPTLDPEEVLAAMGIDVLGETEGHSITCWVRQTGKRFTIKNIGHITVEEVMQAVGLGGSLRLWTNLKLPAPPDFYTLSDVRKSIALAAASRPRFSGESVLGQGVWRHASGLVVVNGDRAWRYKQGRIKRIAEPFCRGRILDFDASRGWCKKLVNEVRVAQNDPDRPRRLYRTLRGFLSKWNWQHQYDPSVVAALVFCTLVQSVWSWRPLVSIIGPSDAGKSTLLNELLRVVLGDWSIVADRCTEAGIRQAIGHDGAPVLIDEFDLYQHRQKVLELFRTASRGGRILRGTQNQQGMSFEVRHLPWFFAIESGDLWGQDRNRFIRLELDRPKDRGNLQLPSKEDLEAFGRQIAGAAIWAASAAADLADQIKRTKVEGVHGRLIESFSVPAAMTAVLSYGTDASEEQATEILHKFVANRGSIEAEGEPDEMRLLSDILAATLQVPIRGRDVTTHETRTVAQLLIGDQSDEQLQALGIRQMNLKGDLPHRIKPVLFLVADTVRGGVLSKTRWNMSRIDQVLARIPGAQRMQQRCGGLRSRGVAIPWQVCLEIIGSEQSDQDSDEAT